VTGVFDGVRVEEGKGVAEGVRGFSEGKGVSLGVRERGAPCRGNEAPLRVTVGVKVSVVVPVLAGVSVTV